MRCRGSRLRVSGRHELQRHAETAVVASGHGPASCTVPNQIQHGSTNMAGGDVAGCFGKQPALHGSGPQSPGDAAVLQQRSKATCKLQFIWSSITHRSAQQGTCSPAAAAATAQAAQAAGCIAVHCRGLTAAAVTNVYHPGKNHQDASTGCCAAGPAPEQPTQQRDNSGSGASRRPAEREGHHPHRNQGRLHRQAVSHRAPCHRGHQLRVTQVGAPASRQRRRHGADTAAAGRALQRAHPQPQGGSCS